MRKRGKIERKYYIIIFFLVVLVILGLLIYLVRDERKTSIVEQALQDSILFVQKIVSAPIHFVTDKLSETKEKNDIYKKYKELQTRVEEVESIEAKNKELESELQELKALLELGQTLSESTPISASVIIRNIDGWYQTITIDKGRHDGIKENMAVITGQGMIGEVIQTNNFSSTVKLLTSVDENHKISVKIEGNEGYIYGLLSGYENQVYKIEGIAENTEIQEGAFVVTTGLGNTYPSGILVGTVTQVKKDHFDLARTILVKPSVNFDEIRYVTVLKK